MLADNATQLNTATAPASTPNPVPDTALTPIATTAALPIWQNPTNPDAVAACPCSLAIAPEIASDNDEPLARLTRHIGSTTAVTVPLFIGLPATGTYTLSAAQVLNFSAGAQPFLPWLT